MDVPHRLIRAAALIVLALAFAVGAGVQAWRDSATFDEPVYLSTGVAALTQSDVTVNPEHAPLFKALAALPVLTVHPVEPDRALSGDEQLYSAAFLRAQQATGRWHAVVFSGRLVPIGEAVLAGFLIALLAAQLIRPGAGLMAAALWWSAPMVLGYGHLNGLDLPFALTTVATALALIRLRERRRPGNVALVGVACGLAVAAQFAGLLLVGVALVLAVNWARTWRTALGWGIGLAAVAWATVWVGYLVFDPSLLLHATWGLPAPMWSGIAYLRQDDTVPANAYLLGMTWSGGRWWYWPVSFVIKTPVTTVLLIATGFLAWWWTPRERAVARVRRLRGAGGVVVVAPLVVLTLALFPDPRDIGARYLLPQLALFVVVAGATVVIIRHRVVRAAVAAALVGSVLAGALSAPHSIAYASAPFAPAYRSVSNSSVDWGQDLALLQHWAVGKHPYVSYFGPRGTGPQDVPGATELVGVDPASVVGWVAVSATNLTTERATQLAWLRKYCPVTVLGGSVLVYDFATPPTASPGPSRPPQPCEHGV